MQQLLERLIGLVKGSRTENSVEFPPAEPGGNGASDSSDVFDALSDKEIEDRIATATSQLAELGAFEDTSSVPMKHLTDAQLEERIVRVEAELDQLGGA